jgi:lipoate-protein ligase A
MHFLDLTLPSPAENLACDEALLDFFEEGRGMGVLRFWEPQTPFVVVGYGNHVQTEVNVPACEAAGIPIFRRCSGGGTVLQGVGCLNYSLVLKIEENGPLHSITAANKFIMEQNRAAIEACRSRREEAQTVSGKNQRLVTSSPAIEIRGHTDLAVAPRPSTLDPFLKFSGNAQRRKKHFLLFHGTFLLNFDIPLIEKYLRMPSKEPDYRLGRSHKNFLTNLDLPSQTVKVALRAAWSAADELEELPRDATALLARDKYVTREWNFKF